MKWNISTEVWSKIHSKHILLHTMTRWKSIYVCTTIVCTFVSVNHLMMNFVNAKSFTKKLTRAMLFMNENWFQSNFISKIHILFSSKYYFLLHFPRFLYGIYYYLWMKAFQCFYLFIFFFYFASRYYKKKRKKKTIFKYEKRGWYYHRHYP